MKPRQLDKIIDSYRFITKEFADSYLFVFVERDSFPDHVSGNIYSLTAMRTLQRYRENETWMSRYYYPSEIERGTVVLVASEIGGKEDGRGKTDKGTNLLEEPFPGEEKGDIQKKS